MTGAASGWDRGVGVRAIAGNALHLAVGSAGRKVITLIYFVIIARYAGLGITGLFYLVVCYGSLFIAVVDLGLTNTFIREASRDPARMEDLFSRTVTEKLLAAGAGLVLAVGLVSLLPYPPITKHLIYIVLGTVVLRSFAVTFFACFRVLHDMRHEARALVIGNLATLVLVSAAVYFRLSPYVLILATTADGVVSFGIAWYLVTRRFRLRLRLGPLLAVEHIFVAAPYMLSALFMEASSFDAVVLQKFMGEDFVARYGVVARPIASARFLPVMFGLVLFASFSRAHHTGQEAVNAIFVRAQYMMLALAIPLAAWAIAGAPVIIDVTFGPAYQASVVPFQIMSLSLLPMFLTYPALALLNACSLQGVAAGNLGLAIVAHVGLSIWLIPDYGVAGAATASTLSAALLASACWYAGWRAGWIGVGQPGGPVAALCLGTLAMVGVLWASHGRLPFLLAAATSGVAYLVGVYVGGGLEGGRFRRATAARRLRTYIQLLREPRARAGTSGN